MSYYDMMEAWFQRSDTLTCDWGSAVAFFGPKHLGRLVHR